MMRKRFNPNAVCSSENYAASKRAHRAMLEEAHASFSEPVCSGKDKSEELAAKVKLFRAVSLVTISVFGKPLRITREEFKSIAKPLGFKLY